MACVLADHFLRHRGQVGEQIASSQGAAVKTSR
jgi:hypothetical protein